MTASPEVQKSKSQPLHLALCTTELAPGGAERCLVELAVRLDRRRFEPVVYSLAPEPRGARRSLVERLEAAGTRVHFLDGRGARSAPGVCRRMAKLLAAQRAELLQTFLFHANLVGRIAGRRARVPHVVCGLRVAERRANGHLRLDRWTTRLVNHYVCVSEAVRDFSIERGGLAPERLSVIANGVDLAQFDSARAADLASVGVPAGRQAVTYVGRLDAQKGLRGLVAGAHLWLERLAEFDLLLVGEGPLRSQLETQVEQLGLAARVHFAGWRGDVPEILRASRLLVLPSEWEGMPNVVLEAMAAALAVVATDVEGVRELLGGSADAQVVARGAEHALAERIVAVLSDAPLAARLGAENRSRAMRCFSIEAMVAAYAALYERLAGRQ
ncbi:MAG TPA: glycosyltransferase [Pirellulales bacterium]|jgi:glycosyltransferase involved in cell wall biosynthesis|nr:glycosyltransferase [Pirellulales bacterium]